MIEPQRNSNASNSTEVWLLTFAILGVLGSALYLFARYIELQTGYHLSLPVSANVVTDQKDAVLAEAPLATAEPTVLGEQTSCIDLAQYKSRVLKVRPEIVLYVGTTPYTLGMQDLVDCASFSYSQKVIGRDCREIAVSYDVSCVDAVVRKTAFFEAKEVLSSPDRKITTQVRISDESTDLDALAEKIVEAINAGVVYDTLTSPYVTIKQIVLQAPVATNLPNTDGTFANRYIEVDGSRQMLFVWDKGKYRTFRISGAFVEYNPVGIHHVINKSKLAWSSTASKWMPYWMAFAFDNNQRAWLGFHSLVYWYPGYKQTGTKKIYEPISNIGKPRSTGCIRMTDKDSKTLFDWAKVGDLVLVHN